MNSELLRWQQISERLYLALRGTCRCEFQRNADGVPIWEGVPLRRVLVRRCSACVALEAFEEAQS